MRQRSLEQKAAAICALMDPNAVDSATCAGGASVAAAPTEAQSSDVTEVVGRLGDAATQQLSLEVRSQLGIHAKEFGDPTDSFSACPSCLFAMLPAGVAGSSTDRSPMLLVPCGHTLCSWCARGLSQTACDACPQCNVRVQTLVVNRPLLQAAALVAERRASSSRIGASTADAAAPSASQLRVRVGLLEEQRSAEEEELTALTNEIDALGAEAARLAEGETELRAEIARLEARRREVNDQLSSRRELVRASEAEAASHTRQAEVLEAALIGLRRDREKCRFMVEHYGPPELLAGLVEGQ